MANLTTWLEGRKLSAEPLNGEQLAKGDRVTFTNDQGVSFEGLTVLGFDSPIYEGSGTVYLDYDCYWYPAKAGSLVREPSVR